MGGAIVKSNNQSAVSHQRAEIYQLPLMLGNGLTVQYVYGDITQSLVGMCEKSWLKMAIGTSLKNTTGSMRGPGLLSFCTSFYERLDILDPEQEIMSLLAPRVMANRDTKEALLLRIVKYLFSVPGDNFRVKSKIRSLGRAHARCGIKERHLNTFNRVLLITLTEHLEDHATFELIRAWHDLLAFVTHQMTFDKVSFKPHMTSSVDEAAAGANASSSFDFSTKDNHVDIVSARASNEAHAKDSSNITPLITPLAISNSESPLVAPTAANSTKRSVSIKTIHHSAHSAVIEKADIDQQHSTVDTATFVSMASFTVSEIPVSPKAVSVPVGEVCVV